MFSIKLSFGDDEDDGIKDVVINVKDEDGNVVSTAKTDSKGNIKLDLKPGKYSFEIKEVPDGFILPAKSRSFTVTESGSTKGTTDVSIEPTKVELSSESVSGSVAPGATITVYDSDGDVAYSGTTDDNGKLSIKGLAPGRYTYKETSAAPGHSIDTNVYSFTVDDDGDITGTLSTSSEPIETSLSVTDSSSGQGISNSTLVVKDQSGKVVASLTTGSDGKASISGLTPGDYYVSQTGTSGNYKADATSYQFSVSSSGVVTGITEIKNDSVSSVVNGSQPSASENNAAVSPENVVVFESDEVYDGGAKDSTSTKPENVEVIKTGVEDVASNKKGLVGVIAGLAATITGAVVSIKRRKK